MAELLFALLIGSSCSAMAIGLHRGIFSAPTQAVDWAEFLFELIFAIFAVAAFFSAYAISDL